MIDQTYINEVVAALELAAKPTPENMEISEKLLDEVLPQKGPLPAAFLTIGVDSNIPLAIRKSALALMNMEIRCRWKEKDSFLKLYNKFSYWYPEDVKQLVRQSYLDAMILANDRGVLKQLGETLREVMVRESNNNIIGFCNETLSKMITNPTPEKVYAMLVAINAIIKSMQYSLNEDRAILNGATQTLMTNLLDLCHNVGAVLNEVNLLILQKVFKIVYRTVRIDLPPYFRQEDANMNWMKILFSSLENSAKELHKIAGTGATSEDINKNVHTKTIKWIERILSRYAFRYGSKKNESKENKKFAEAWENTYIGNLWNLNYQIIEHYRVLNIPKNLVSLIIKTMHVSEKSRTIKESYKESVLAAISGPLFNVLEFDAEDEEQYKENPIEYFRLNDPDAIKFNSKREAISFMVTAIEIFGKKGDNRFYENIIKHCKEILANQQGEVIKQEAAMLVIERLVSTIHSNSGNEGKDYFLKQMTSYLNNSHGFVRMRAYKLIAALIYPDFEDNETLSTFSTAVVVHVKDEELPVRCAAAQALQKLLIVPILKEFFKPHLKDILFIFLKIVSEFESDTLLSVFSDVFRIYQDEITPFAVDLVKSLTDLFFKLVDKENEYIDKEDDEGEMESGSAGISCLNGIEKLFTSTLPKEVLDQSWACIERLYQFVLANPNGFDYNTDVAAIMTEYLVQFKEGIPDALWPIYSIYCYMIIGLEDKKSLNVPSNISPGLKQAFIEMEPGDLGCELFTNLIGVFANMIILGKQRFPTTTGFAGEPLPQLTIKLCQTVIERQISSNFDDQDVAFALILLGYMVLAVGDQLGNVFEEALKTGLDVINHSKKATYINAFLFLFGNAMYVSPMRTIEYLNSQGKLKEFMESWVAFHPNSIVYKVRRSSFLGLTRFLSFTNEQPEALPIKFDRIFLTMANDLKKLAYEQEAAINEDAEDDEDDMGGFGMGDDDEDEEEGDYLDSAIADTHKEIEDLQENGGSFKQQGEFDYDAYEALNPIDQFHIADILAEVNEITLFDSALVNIQSSNPQLFSHILGLMSKDLQQQYKDAVEKSRALYASK